MIKTSFDPVQILYDRLSSSELVDELSGKLYKMVRPNGSKLEDIVINGLPISADQFQEASTNVNLYVPDIQVSTNQFVPDTARLAYLASIAVNFLYEYYGDGYRYNFRFQGDVEEAETEQHYINLRIDFEFFPDS